VKDQQRDLMRKAILELVRKGHVHWTDLKKRILGSCHPFATDATFAAQMRYLLDVGMIRRESRGIYKITEKGTQYLKIMTSNFSSLLD
jgi:predicted transcriptional regulator